MAVLEVISLGSSRCGVRAQGQDATLVSEPKWISQLIVGDVVYLHNPRATWEENEMTYYVEQTAGAQILVRHSPKRGKIHIAELYAGLSGWDAACSIIGEKVDFFVEKDPTTARVCAMQHGIPMVTAKQFIANALAGENIERCVICGDCQDPEVWAALGLGNVGTIGASPPCQPWCSVGRASGLNSLDGELLPATGKWAGRLGVALLLLENVAGLTKHGDFSKAIQEIEKHGMMLRLHGNFGIHKVMPVKRDRWLATFVHAAVQLSPERIQLAQNISFDNRSFQSVAVSPTMASADTIHVNMTDAERHQLNIPEDVMQMLSDIKYAPTWIQNKGIQQSGEPVLNARIVQPEHQCSGIMASYGSQHKIPDDLLSTSGLHTSITTHNGQVRYFSPWEFASMLGYGDKIILSSDLGESWRMSGNGLSVAHGWLQLHKTHVMLGDASPFLPPGTIEEQVRRFQESAIKMSCYATVIEGANWKLIPLDCEHASKRARCDDIPATVAFFADEGDQDSIPCGTTAWAFEPQFESMGDPRCIAVQGETYAGGMIVLMHDQKHWTMFINVPKKTTVAAIIVKGLPHADISHFTAFTLEGTVLQWTDEIECFKLQTLVFTPKTIAITCQEESLQIALNLVIDVTWTSKTALAFGAVKLGCNPDVLCLTVGGKVLSDDDYLTAYEVCEFHLRFKACLPPYVEWAPIMSQISDEGMKPVRTSQQRWFARHPAKKVIRTVAADYDTDVTTLVQLLFPDLHGSSSWKVFDSVTEVPGDAFANAWGQLQIQWDGFRPFRVTEIQVVNMDTSIDNPCEQAHGQMNGKTMWIKTPFQTQAKCVKIIDELTLGEVAASFFVHTQVATNMLCMKGAVVLDPLGTIADCDDDSVISFRMCPMIGGAKYEAVRQRLKQMLEDKGVPKDKSLDRLNGFASKASLDKLSHMKDCDDEGFWNHVKSMATDVSFRLITSQELKSFQQETRKAKSKGKGGLVGLQNQLAEIELEEASS
eukprot:Skav227643  [mRNA]  locus=scaffold58:206038:211570:- [translate_table: standard]